MPGSVTTARTPLWRALILSWPALVLLVATAIWNPRGEFWVGVEFPKAQCEAYDSAALRRETHVSDALYSAAKLQRLFREPQNTVSNAAYAVVGLAILLAATKPAARALGAAGVFLGWGSGVYHASLLPEWRMIDILGVYAVLFCLIWVGVSALARKFDRSLIAWVGSLVVWAAAIYAGVHRNEVRFANIKVFDSTYVMVVCVTIGSCLAGVAIRKSTNIRASRLALGLLCVSAPLAFVGGQADRFGGFWAAPDALVQGHSVWHLLGAVAIWAAYEIFALTGFDRSTIGTSPREQSP